MVKVIHNKSALHFVLLACIPYSTPSLMLAYRPNLFFNELERLSKHPEPLLRDAFNRAKKRKLIKVEKGKISFTAKGRLIVQPFIAKKLRGGGKLMVIFDIPEDYADRRRRFRSVLRYLKFQQIQQSVWMSENDYREVIIESIQEIHLHDWVQLYEAARIDKK